VRKIKRSASSKNEQGFTFVEVMVALLIISLIGVVVWQGSVRSGRLLDRISRESLITLKLMRTESALRDAVAEIRIPFWVSEAVIEESDGELVIPFYEGSADALLVVKCEDGSIVIGTRSGGEGTMEKSATFGPFAGTAVELARDNDDRPFGIRFTLRVQDGSFEPVEITARFGSNPFWTVKTS
jgi:prepilin-type N-terminal cleavage/methylation domain-containing protein